MRTIYVATLFSLSSLVSARALSPIEAIAGLARQKRQDGDDLKIDGVDINYSGCDEINPKTNNKMSKDIANTWDDAIALANAVTEIDTGTDIGSFDYFGPNMQTDGMGYKILSVYNNLGSFGRNFFWGWRVNVFCPSEDEKLHRGCEGGTSAFQWDTICKDGRCPCDTRDADGNCNKHGDDGFKRDPDKSTINIQFCPIFFAYPSLKEAMDKGKNAPKEQKYNMNTYWDNRGKILFHEVLHGSTVGQHANEGIMITDLKIKIRKHDKPDELQEVKAYGPLNSKMLARTIRNENFEYVRQNDDNWSAYALAKHIQKEVGVYPILPLADDHVYDAQGSAPPKALFLTNGDKTLVNSEIYNSDTLFKSQDYFPTPGVEQEVVDDTTFRPASDYPKWYIERLQKARNGDLDGTGETPGQPEEPKQPEQPAGPSKAGKTLQMFWEVEPGPPPLPVPGIGTIPVIDKYFWYFYVGEVNKGSDPCNSDPIDTHFEAPKGKDFPIVVDGEWEFDIPDLGKCKFQGIGKVGESGDNGWLHCPNRPAIMCRPDERPIDNCKSDTTVKSKAISFCDW